MRLNCRASVSSPPHSGQRAPATWSARKRCLQPLQSTSGSVKPARWPEASHTRVHDDRRVEADDVVATGDDLSPPGLLHVALELDPERAVVEARAEAAVDLAARVDEPPPLAEVHHLLHRRGGHR